MAIGNWLVGCSMAISLATSLVMSVANAEPIGGVRASEGLQAPVFIQIPDALDRSLPVVGNALNEAVIQIPEGDISLETTVFKPDGAGPFPMIVFNHGKLPGDSHAQPRNRPVALAREFVRHGYVVVVPNRRGFAGSGGTDAGHGCDVEANSYSQAKDVAATVSYMSEQPYVDKTHIVVTGTSHSGLTTIAYGAREGYRNFLNQYSSRAFAVSDSGAWSWAEGGDDPMAVAIASCQKQSRDPCHLYAVNNHVVWRTISSGGTQTTSR